MAILAHTSHRGDTLSLGPSTKGYRFFVHLYVRYSEFNVQSDITTFRGRAVKIGDRWVLLNDTVVNDVKLIFCEVSVKRVNTLDRSAVIFRHSNFLN